ncbi:MAG TPA: hypothetical protein VHC22_27910 [Pirellulales bacterium]|nr:hypothetical protein [Pirellulales bacterium]
MPKKTEAPQFHFRHKTTMWVLGLLGAFFAGMAWEQHQHPRQQGMPQMMTTANGGNSAIETMVLPDGNIWFRVREKPDGKLILRGQYGERITIEPPPPQEPLPNSR